MKVSYKRIFNALVCTFSLYPLSIGAVAFSNAYFGAGMGTIHLDEVQCNSSASQLLDCPSNPIASHDCLHSADAGVSCEGIFQTE